MTRGEVWLAALDPTVGSEIRKTRPCVIVSPDDLNATLRTFTVCPLTSGSRPALFRVETSFAGKDGRILPDQMRTLDRTRLIRRIGRLDRTTLGRTLATLRALFAE